MDLLLLQWGFIDRLIGALQWNEHFYGFFFITELIRHNGTAVLYKERDWIDLWV
jgi:hypothetical protein